LSVGRSHADSVEKPARHQSNMTGHLSPLGHLPPTKLIIADGNFGGRVRKGRGANVLHFTRYASALSDFALAKSAMTASSSTLVVTVSPFCSDNIASITD